MTQPGSTPSRPRRGAGCLQSLVVLAVILGLAYGASKVFGDKDSSSKASSSSSASDGKGGSWEVGDCGGPDPENKPDGYRAFDCDDKAATFKALEIKSASILPNAIQCPAGTDLIIQVSRVFGSGDDKKSSGIPTNTVCGRNLSDDHPGDAGAGGGQLVKGDCITSTAKEIACAEAGSDAFKVLDLVKEKEECPAATTEPMQLMMAMGRPYDVICGGKV
ncbi:hypothetical protein ACFY9H_10450 [Streptomyces bacillaris]|uniref:Uncharacterized protein n=1 Tax=Streptomyces cavourensis TaxID=67258 RepID=A0AAD0VER8_9ACTN|nr:MULTISPECIES: hypothetical protein [Streptomyces]AXI71990.1 hypothetical protein DTW94_12390 [Streptomyces cavourensis]MCR8945855.1 hypothetical protein [Streptomyces sp. OUCMDZ-4982]NUV42841.1 hypothetical protein [Streptomyces sp. CAI-24]UTR82385.1 hypothetical protein NLU04_29910 [Streptomyces cavourensis]WAE66541.1 hypothetical protein OUQ49_12705 [Streptomyces cavourensis]